MGRDLPVRAILWDFGDTLADERWMHAPLPGSPHWPSAYAGIHDNGLAQRWDVGQIAHGDVATALAAELGRSTADVVAHMEACCRQLSFFPRVMELVRRCDLPQAIVTINCDIFSDVVVPAYDLERHFQAIVTSWQERTPSKADLCEIAMARLGDGLRRDESLLIDNRIENVFEWRARGGAAYHFVDQAALAEAFDELVSGVPLDGSLR